VRASTGTRKLPPRGSLVVCAAGIALCGFSLVPGLLGAKGSMYGDQAMHLAATAAQEYRFGDSDWNVESPLSGVALDATAETERRNVVFVHLESVRARSMTPYNKDLETTPYLDSLADEGLLAERAYTPVPYSSKSLVSVNCGIYPHPTTDIKESEKPGAIPARCLPELLGKEGYRTAWFQSSWKDFENWPQLVENFGYGEFYPLDSMNREGFEEANYWSYEDDIMLQPSREWLEKKGDEPFVVTYVTGTPHHDYLAPDRYGHLDFPRDGRLNDEHNERLNDYLNSVRYVDFFVRNLIEQYKEMGLYEDTIFVFFGDHGEAFYEHGLKTHGPTPYDETLQVPLIIHDPQRFHNGERVSAETPVNHLDIAPTVLDLLGYEVTNGEYPGSSLLRPIAHDRTLMFNCRPDVECAASLNGYEKYIYFYGRKPDEKYDLRVDPSERNDLAGKTNSGDLERQRDLFLEWRLKTMAMYNGGE
jgi:lipoteichoic acid synthase